MISESACQLMCGASQFANDGIFDEIEYFKEDNRIVLKRVGLFSDSTEALTLQGEKANRLKRILDSEIENESIRE